jgi:hypothetical protein
LRKPFYGFFLVGSSGGVLEVAPAPAEPDAEPLALPEALGGCLLAPPAAEPEAAPAAGGLEDSLAASAGLSFSAEGAEGVAALLDEELGGVPVAPPVLPAAELLDDAPGAGEADGGDAVSLFAAGGEPGADVVRSGPLSQAARPNASAVASASVDSFMFPPWLGYRKRAAICAPGLTL